ncbi:MULTISPECIES: NADH-quinone oxidoreductase subunit N [Butyricimonas]|uniref:NADH-quinone oxidoreductase subunit N n=1 Tax=Butyricimonas TaxID=574697 RepID=UPI001D06E1F8|nr:MULTISPECIES: NADH-quinone oxidoreductase subunit N [Butyricimonas]MCB6971454.1 NADH-quinone oxidoreductase subunit N [Butyricimonas synergistica]MCG4518168.1 NADH-quinone oxidoreductase subunit N [Butyricimonas sp. DFI.6.44]
MVYANFLLMKEEVSLIAVIVILLVYDIFGSPKSLKYFQPIACILVGIHTLLNLSPNVEISAFGGMYHNLPMGSIMKTILNIGTLIVFMQANNWLASERTIIRRGEFYMITLATLLGMYFMISAGNFLMFFIGLETASIPMACLAAFDKYKQKSAEAGAKYILTAVFASGLSLYGISLIYGTTGTLYFEDIPAGLNGSLIQLMAFVFFFVGLGFKLSLVPFHQWTPDVYEGAPTSVTAYLSVISKGSSAFVFMAILYKVFAPLANEWQSILYWIIIASITLANFFALRQQNLKRFFAYSSISQAGYIMLGIISGTAMGMTGLVYYVLVYMLSNLAAFGVIAIVEHRSGKLTIDDYNGLYSTNPRLSFVMMLALFSLAGIPPFAGFFSKFFIFAAAAEQGYYVLVFVALINTVISLYYYLRVIKAMFINKSEMPIESFRSDGYTRVSLLACSAGILCVGILSIVYESIGTFSFGSY